MNWPSRSLPVQVARPASTTFFVSWLSSCAAFQLVHDALARFLDRAPGQARIEEVAGFDQHRVRHIGRQFHDAVFDQPVAADQHHQGAARAPGVRIRYASTRAAPSAPAPCRRSVKGPSVEIACSRTCSTLLPWARHSSSIFARSALASAPTSSRPLTKQAHAGFGGHAAGGGMRRIEQPAILQIGHHVAGWWPATKRRADGATGCATRPARPFHIGFHDLPKTSRERSDSSMSGEELVLRLADRSMMVLLRGISGF